MHDQTHWISLPEKRAATFVLSSLILVCAVCVFAGQYFDKEDEKGIEHFSMALTTWYEVNQVGQPRSEADFKRIIYFLKRVHSECAKVPDKTLRKIDAELARTFRSDLQEGARLFAIGMSDSYKAKEKGAGPTAKAKDDMNNGQRKMVKFHQFYNANIERIIQFLRSKGVEILG